MSAREQYEKVYSALRACVNAQFSELITGDPDDSFCSDLWCKFDDLCAGMNGQHVNAARTSYLESLHEYKTPSGVILKQMLSKRNSELLLDTQS